MKATIKYHMAFISVEEDPMSDLLGNSRYHYAVKMLPSAHYFSPLGDLNDSPFNFITLRCNSFEEMFEVLGYDKEPAVGDKAFASTISEFLAKSPSQHSILVRERGENQPVFIYKDSSNKEVEYNSLQELYEVALSKNNQR